MFSYNKGEHTQIYFDNASTALPVYAYPENNFGNPSTTHALGIKAYDALMQAKKDLCKILGCETDELVFTSGGTESNNLAIIGYATAHKRSKLRFAALPWAHPSVNLAIKQVDTLGFGSQEALCTKSLACLEGENSTFAHGSNFISIPQICHETGDIYDVEKIASYYIQLNPKNIIHIDGVQGFCKNKINLKNIHLYSFSGHKIHAPCGTGGLYVKKGVRLSALLFGGGQEMGLRAGTHNTYGAVALANSAKEQCEKMESHFKKANEVKAELKKIVDELGDVYVNYGFNTSPYILNMSFIGAKAEVLVNMLSENGIYVSTGAACKVSKKEVPALVQMGFDKERADSAIRFSFSHHNTVDEACLARKTVARCVALLRKIRG